MSHISEYADPFDVDRMLECMAQVNQRLLVTSKPGQSFSFSGGVHIVNSLSKLNHKLLGYRLTWKLKSCSLDTSALPRILERYNLKAFNDGQVTCGLLPSSAVTVWVAESVA